MQSFMQEMLQSVDGVTIYTDDMLVFAETKGAHNATLWKVLHQPEETSDFNCGNVCLARLRYQSYACLVEGIEQGLKNKEANAKLLVPKPCSFPLPCSFVWFPNLQQAFKALGSQGLVPLVPKSYYVPSFLD